jgi:hypothetical protein
VEANSRGREQFVKLRVTRIESFEDRMISRVITTALAISIACDVTGCHRGQAATIVPVPSALDSAGVERWLSQQRAACRGHLITLWDKGGAVRSSHSAGMLMDFPSRSGLVGVQCQP